jgi:catechol 2,3-dioxygenase-like lactoylglutathione lyase family enzyme
LDQSVEYYTGVLGMRESGRVESSSNGMDPSDPLNGMTKVYLRYGEDASAPMLSLIWSPEAKAATSTESISTYAGLAISVPDLSRVREGLVRAGCEVSEMMSVRDQQVTRVFAADPDGNKLELVEWYRS